MSRERLPMFEAEDERIKVNLVAHWTFDELDGYFGVYDLPRRLAGAGGRVGRVNLDRDALAW
ncbi:hypothetical protein CCR85_14435 [Rhodothalassium salexigens]|uniref:hypothetical protein n=1 Tax=Rhodothalassium salexigens TaxID=1086 RepID=UPI00191172F6|nr:hypothetical protein [Rhodothalassium salexigens]MBK5912678.1 hypothetical protein [Rhodothalassium salexigens]MBK5920257.1 hypothetical protein [Rhodothalassium salexigens]